MNDYNREPTPDERAGMNWWNGLDPLERTRLLWRLHEMGIDETPAECWRVFGRHQCDQNGLVRIGERIRQ